MNKIFVQKLKQIIKEEISKLNEVDVQDNVDFIEEYILNMHNFYSWDTEEDKEETRRKEVEQRKLEYYKNFMGIWLPLFKKWGNEKGLKVFRAVELYSTNNYGRTNNSLRNNKIPPKALLVDEFIKEGPKFTGSTLYRGLGRDYFRSLLELENFTEPAFVSTTEDEGVARYFSKRRLVGGILVITGKVGLAASLTDSLKISKYSKITEGEHEYILPRNTKFTILKKTKDTIWVRI